MADRYYDSFAEYEARHDLVPVRDHDEDYHTTKAQRTDRLSIRLARQESPDLDISDYSESEEATPRGNRKRKLATGRTGRSKPIMTDANGVELSPTEAKKIRKRATNRESARRMRQLRKEEHNTLQQEVHTKSLALSKYHQMNNRINQEFSKLLGENQHMAAKIQTLEGSLEVSQQTLEVTQQTLGKVQAHSTAVKHLCGSLLEGLGSDQEAQKLREFASLVTPLLELSTKAKATTPNTINITASSTGASFKGLEAAKILPDAETPRCYAEQANRHYHSDDSPLAPLANSYNARIEELVAQPRADPAPVSAGPKKVAMSPVPLPCLETAPFPVGGPLGQCGFGMGELPNADIHNHLDSFGFPPVPVVDGTSGSGAWLLSNNSLDNILLNKQLSMGSLDFNSWSHGAEHLDGQ